jgi:DUF2892 family protein
MNAPANRLLHCCSHAASEREFYELQARKVAGVIVLIGVALGLFVHPYWFGLSAFIGAALILSGITGMCPMASLLAKIPGNCPRGVAWSVTK